MASEATAPLRDAVRPWLDLIDTLRAQGVQQDLPLPQIAVMGDQSSGKSSVLEAISGIPFPRGSGLVTRCATQLTMKNVPEGFAWRAHVSVNWAKPQPAASGSVKDPAELAAKINELTDVLCGEGNNFSQDSIVVRVEAPGAPDLTIIDLPGIVRTATAGQQFSVIAQVNELIGTYLKQERTIILAVIPSNQDIATIDILERARTVDPEGNRTLGVLTKPDLIGPGSESEVMAVLRNERKPLKLGYIMVKCRSQRDLDKGMSPAEAKAAEERFFSEHPDWREVKRPVLGVGHLTACLTELLVERIHISLPFIKWELQSQLTIVQRELAPLGNGAPTTVGEQRNRLMRLMSAYCGVMRQSARGFYSDPLLADGPEVRLFGKCQEAFEVLKRKVMASRPGFGDPAFGELLAADMAALRGRELPGFHNSQAFYNFIAKSVEGWRPFVEECKMSVVTGTRAVSAMVLQKLVPSYPSLNGVVTEMVTRLVGDYSDDLSSKLDEIFVKESDPFTTNENMLELVNTLRFRNFDKALEQVMATVDDRDEKKGLAEVQAVVAARLGGWYMHVHGVNVKSKVEDMTIMIEAYWDVATKRLVDNVCMTMEHDFLGRLLKQLEEECFVMATDSFKEEGARALAALFDEDPVLAERRAQVQSKRDRLAAALETLRRMAPDCVAAQQQQSS